MSVFKRGNKYWIDIRYNRFRYRKSSPENSYSGAKAYEAMLRQKIVRGEPVEAERKPEKKYIFNEFSQKFFNVYVKNNNKKSEIIQKESILRNHLKPFFGKKELKKISSLDIENYKAIKIKAGLSNKTINNQLIVLIKCLKVAEEWGVLEKLPKIKKLKVQPQKFDFLSEEECQLLINKADNLFKEMFLLAIRTGLRFGELIAIDWSDINFNEKLLTVRRSIVLGEMGGTKSSKIRYIPLTSDVSSLLTKRYQKKGLVFSKDNGEPLKQYYCCEKLYSLCKKIGLRKIGWHTFRHTFASHLVQNGVSIKVVQELLGHSDITTTMRYSHLGPSTLRESINTLEPNNGFNLNFGHHMGTTQEKLEFKEEIKDVKSP